MIILVPVNSISIVCNNNTSLSALPVNNILPCLKIGVEEFKLSLPLLVSLRNPVLKARHLNAIEALTGTGR